MCFSSVPGKKGAQWRVALVLLAEAEQLVPKVKRGSASLALMQRISAGVIGVKH